jgi:HKD family nuclease
MNVEYIAQPNIQIGKIMAQLLDAEPKRIVFVSAFVGLQTVLRIKDQVLDLQRKGGDIRFVLGIDLGGTSQEVLNELLGWNIYVCIVKHRIPGHTFHPKFYLFEWGNKVEIIIGSNNITEGGFFGNYEGCARITYNLPDDFKQFERACAELKRFIFPDGPTAHELTCDFLKELIARKEVPTEAEARYGRDVSREPRLRKLKAAVKEKHLFGVEDIEPPPPLPADLLERLVQDVRRRRKERRKPITKRIKKRIPAVQLPIDDKAIDMLLPAAFYMTLPTLQGENIPGEGRIPLEAVELAKEFWGWPDEYTKDVSPRAGKERVYWNWRPVWRVRSVEAPDKGAIQEVRMYMYENSSDFRFYVRPLVNAGADLGDVVRIRRIAQSDAEYECVLARKGTPEYDEWIRYCTQSVRNSTRLFGYA